jgi:acetyl esterase/lipase
VPFYGVFDWTNRFGIRPDDDGLHVLLEKRVVKKSRAAASEVFDRASPMSRVGENAPPAMVIHGTKDNLAPVAEARKFVELLREQSGAAVVYVELDGAHHAFEVFHSVRTQHALSGVEGFASWICRHRGTTASD